MNIIPADFDDPRVAGLLLRHMELGRENTAPGSAHALDLQGVRRPDVRIWTAWDGDTLLGVGGLRRLGADHAEVKAMHTDQAQRRRGVGRAMLNHLVATARADGITRLSLETGSWPYFAPAVAFYRAHGFTDCGPFGDYRPDPNSLFMTRTL